MFNNVRSNCDGLIKCIDMSMILSPATLVQLKIIFRSEYFVKRIIKVFRYIHIYPGFSCDCRRTALYRIEIVEACARD